MNYSLSNNRDYALWTLLAQARHILYQARQRELKGVGISGTQARALFTIQAIGDRATPAEISRWMGRRPHSTSDLLSRMEKQGLVKKTNDLGRRNLIRVSLTEKGHQAYRQSVKVEPIHRVMSILSPEEHKQLTSLLRRVRDKAIQEFDPDHRRPIP